MSKQIINRIKAKKAFTLAEVMIVVAIIGILGALTVPSLVKMKQKMAQKELDSKAEIIYMAAQNQLLKLRASGNSDVYKFVADDNDNGVRITYGQFDDADTDERHVQLEAARVDKDLEGYPLDGNTSLTYNLFYLSSENRTKSAVQSVMGAGIIDDELFNNHWIVEYNDETGDVYAVYYSEESGLLEDYPGTDDIQRVNYQNYRRQDYRIESGSKVGYYGGDITLSSVGSGGKLDRPTISINNKEKLTAEIKWYYPGTDKLKFVVTIVDASGNKLVKTLPIDYDLGTYSRYEEVGDNEKAIRVNRNGVNPTAILVLDDLSDAGSRFVNSFGETLTPGTDITISVEAAVLQNDGTINGKYEPVKNIASPENTVNSLFASYASEYGNTTVGVAYGRHLQNLDSASGVYIGNFDVVQTSDISFKNNPDIADEWYEVYDNRLFTSISNTSILSYDGDNNSISGLRIDSTGDAGLFNTLTDGTEVMNVRLTGTQIKGNGNVGAIAAKTQGNVSLSAIRVYLNTDSRDNDVRDKDYEDIWLSGTTVGGIVGSVQSGTLGIRDSSASTVISGIDIGGGLVGSIHSGAHVDIACSYADNYIFGESTGGVVGDTQGSSYATISDSYASGYLIGSKYAGGFVNGKAKIDHSYTIVAFDHISDGYALYSTAKEMVGNFNTVYYYRPDDGYNRASEYGDSLSGVTNLVDKLNHGDTSYFVSETTEHSHPYELKIKYSDKSYPYPIFDPVRFNFDHYGDWYSEFQAGSLVYYEKYNDGSGNITYGFSGGNVSPTLSNDGYIVGDGYGIVYKETEKPAGAIEAKVSYMDDAFHPVNKSVFYTVGDYVVYPLDETIVNSSESAKESQFYYSVEVQDGAKSFSYYFNPLFADTVNNMNEFSSALIRTPRHLYSLSLYYDSCYRNATDRSSGDIVFEQDRDINYSKYEWNNFYITGKRDGLTSVGSAVNMQMPIGQTDETAFKDRYDGHHYVVTDISFVSADGSYIGLVGCNIGTLENIVLATDYIPTEVIHYYVHRTNPVLSNSTVYFGILAGYNKATIRNCATAGYYISGGDGTIHSYEGSTMYIGGIAGYNSGSISNSSTVFPKLSVTTLYSSLYSGGVVGSNNGGIISNSYAIGHMELVESKGDGSSVILAGFAADNRGVIENSYCAVALTLSGDGQPVAFCPKMGSVTASYYLGVGTYRFIGSLLPYSFPSDNTYGSIATKTNLESLRGNYRASQDHCYYHSATDTSSLEYPFRAVVTDSDGNYVHYGNWLDDPNMGAYGIFYWEHEEKGANNGYHFSYIGTDVGKIVKGTSLCTQHDDGGVITSYGYGYYVREDLDNSVKLENPNPYLSFGTGYDDNIPRPEAKSALEEQLLGYIFYPYNTGNKAGDNYSLWLDNDKTAGQFKLQYTNGTDVTESTYQINPFFANSMKCCDTVSDGALKLEGDDGFVTDYSLNIGTIPADKYNSDNEPTEGNPYEVRSVQQLRYLNWNYYTKNCDTLVNNSNFSNYPYLMYTQNSDAKDTKDNSNHKTNADLTWLQTHDLNGGSNGEQIKTFTPIAGVDSNAFNNTKSIRLLTWFGSTYNGQGYKIKNIGITTDSPSVGLFGVTVGAKIKNVILFADDSESFETAQYSSDYCSAYNVIQKVTRQGSGAFQSYAIGGLVAIAYDYTKNDARNNYIDNCAVAGYKIIDKTNNSNVNFYSEENYSNRGIVGGLCGIASNIKRCSAVTDIMIDSRHPNTNHRDKFGNQIAVGGLVGSSLYTITDCYSGGSIEVSNETRKEAYTNKANKATQLAEKEYDPVTVLTRENNVHIFVSGLSGSVTSMIYQNVTIGDNASTKSDGRLTISNCYTYTQLPPIGGTLKSVSYIGSVADRYTQDSATLTLWNCYYLDGIADWASDIESGTRYSALGKKWYKFNNGNSKITLVPIEEYSGSLNLEVQDCQTLAAAQTLASKKWSDGTRMYQDTSATYSGINLMLMGESNVMFHTHYSDNTNTRFGSDADVWHAQTLFGQKPQAKSYDELKSIDAKNVIGSNWGFVTTKEVSGGDVLGKYSFPSSSHLSGKDYPFPTIVKQKDLSNSTNKKAVYANVHYGDWPLNLDYYWKDGRGQINMLMDVNNAGVAQKTFYLMDPKGILGGSPISINCGGIASVVYTTYDSSAKRYEVTLKAVKNGSAKVYLEGHEEVSFSLEVSSNLLLSAFEVPSSLADASVSLGAIKAVNRVELFEGQTKNYIIGASPEYGEKWEIISKNLEWTATPGAISGYATLSEDESSYGRYTITAGSIVGDYMVEYQAKYNNASAVLQLPVHINGWLGLSNSTDRVTSASIVYNRVVRSLPDSESSKIGQAYTYSENAPYLKDCEVFLYETLSDNALSKMTVSSVSVNGEDLTLSDDKLSAYNDNYRIEFSSETVSDLLYEYRGAKLRCINSTVPTVALTNGSLVVKVKDGDSGSEYELSLGNGSDKKIGIPVYVISFDSNGGSGTKMPQNIYSFTPQIKPSDLWHEEYSRTGYQFKGWRLGNSDTIYEINKNDPSMETGFVISTDTAIHAEWTPNTYTVKYYANGNEVHTQNLTYGVASNLDAISSYERFVPSGMIFESWNTKSDGTGTSYNDGAEVINLATGSPGNTEIKLYANIVDNYKLTLYANGGNNQYLVEPGTTSIGGIYVAPSPTIDGYTFVGWYTSPSGSGIKLLDTDGSVVANVAGYTSDGKFDLNADKNLYACWTKEVFYSHNNNKLEVDNDADKSFNGPGGSGSGSVRLTDAFGIAFGNGDYVEYKVKSSASPNPQYQRIALIGSPNYNTDNWNAWAQQQDGGFHIQLDTGAGNLVIVPKSPKIPEGDRYILKDSESAIINCNQKDITIRIDKYGVLVQVDGNNYRIDSTTGNSTKFQNSFSNTLGELINMNSIKLGISQTNALFHYIKSVHFIYDGE